MTKTSTETTRERAIATAQAATREYHAAIAAAEALKTSPDFDDEIEAAWARAANARNAERAAHDRLADMDFGR